MYHATVPFVPDPFLIFSVFTYWMVFEKMLPDPFSVYTSSLAGEPGRGWLVSLRIRLIKVSSW